MTEPFCEFSCGRRAAFAVHYFTNHTDEKLACGNHLAAAVKAVSTGASATGKPSKTVSVKPLGGVR